MGGWVGGWMVGIYVFLLVHHAFYLGLLSWSPSSNYATWILNGGCPLYNDAPPTHAPVPNILLQDPNSDLSRLLQNGQNGFVLACPTSCCQPVMLSTTVESSDTIVSTSIGHLMSATRRYSCRVGLDGPVN